MRKRRWWHERTLSEFKRTVRNFLLYDELLDAISAQDVFDRPRHPCGSVFYVL